MLEVVDYARHLFREREQETQTGAVFGEKQNKHIDNKPTQITYPSGAAVSQEFLKHYAGKINAN